MMCYQAEFTGDLTPSSEVEKLAFADYSWKAKSSLVDGLIFDDLRAKGLID